MTKIEFDQFRIAAGETISVQITKSIAPYSVVVSDLTGSTWAPKPADKIEGTFTAPPVAGPHISFGILFNFIPAPAVVDPTTDFYTVTISGASGTPFSEQIFGPGFTTRTYLFTVV